jgi:four helix bundle protein
MEELKYARRFRDLVVYQVAGSVSSRIFELTKSFPKEEMYSLTDQIRRSSRSIGANIAEAWAKRRYEKHFVSKLTDADGEQMETQHWILVAFRCGYLSVEEGKSITEQLKRIGEMLNGMIEKAPSFCGDSTDRVSEDAGFYGTTPEEPF